MVFIFFGPQLCQKNKNFILLSLPSQFLIKWFYSIILTTTSSYILNVKLGMAASPISAPIYVSMVVWSTYCKPSRRTIGPQHLFSIHYNSNFYKIILSPPSNLQMHVSIMMLPSYSFPRSIPSLEKSQLILPLSSSMFLRIGAISTCYGLIHQRTPPLW